MRKVVMTAVLAAVLAAPALSANSAEQRVQLSVDVASVFELSIDQGYVDFGRMKPGETKEDMPSAGITLTAKSNNQRPWYIKISNDREFSNGQAIIPNQNFVWSGWTDGAGKWYGTGRNMMMLTPTLAYSSGDSEQNNLPNGTTNHFKFRLTVPEKQQPGNYTTQVKFTMTE